MFGGLRQTTSGCLYYQSSPLSQVGSPSHATKKVSIAVLVISYGHRPNGGFVRVLGSTQKVVEPSKLKPILKKRVIPMSLPHINESQHPLVAHHLSVLRDKQTPPSLFRQQVQRLAMLLSVEASADLPLRRKEVETPLTVMNGSELGVRVALVPILRAGLGLVDPVLQLIPEAEVWHLGMYRDESTSQPVEYYCKLPEANPPEYAFVLDPMLATGGSIRMAVSSLKKWGVREIRVLSVIGTPVGIERLLNEFPDVRIWVAKIDEGLNEHNFIVPGLGDAGDRIFNTRGS